MIPISLASRHVEIRLPSPRTRRIRTKDWRMAGIRYDPQRRARDGFPQFKGKPVWMEGVNVPKYNHFPPRQIPSSKPEPYHSPAAAVLSVDQTRTHSDEALSQPTIQVCIGDLHVRRKDLRPAFRKKKSS